ncbi:MAG: TonB family protein [Mucilaginibacter sp.]
MLASNLDLCKAEWIDLVFKNRNKEYGAYSLRQQHAGIMIKVMSITFMSVIIALMLGDVMIKYNAATAQPQLRVTTIELSNYVAPKAQQPTYQVANSPATMQKILLPVFSNKPNVVEPIKIINNAPAGPQNIDLSASNGNDYNSIADEAGNSNGTDAQPVGDNDVYTPLTVESKPEPIGGNAAWIAFLQKNLKYPKDAIDVKYHGNVALSFVVEKSGLITNIIVEKSACTSMDEEAVRILKLSKVWKPGYKDGVPVRVKCPMTFNFIMGG